MESTWIWYQIIPNLNSLFISYWRLIGYRRSLHLLTHGNISSMNSVIIISSMNLCSNYACNSWRILDTTCCKHSYTIVFMLLNTWSLVSGAIWKVMELLGNRALLEEIYHDSMEYLDPVTTFMSALCLYIKMEFLSFFSGCFLSC